MTDASPPGEASEAAKAPFAAELPDADKEKSTVFVRNLAYDVNDEILAKAFEDIGPIKHAFVVVDKKHVTDSNRTGGSRGFGFVQFALVSDAERAVQEMTGKKVSGRKVKVYLAKKKDDSKEGSEDKEEKSANKTAKRPRDIPAVKGAKRNGARPDMAVPAKKKRKLPPPAAPGTYDSLVVSGFDESLDVQTIRKRVRKLGTIVCFFAPAPESMPGCFAARVQMSTNEEAAAVAKKLDGHTVHGFTLKVTPLRKKAARLILRNLPFTCEKSNIDDVFSKLEGTEEVEFPVNAEGQCRGFAFVQYADLKTAKAAIDKTNGRRVLGRKMVVDWALSKGQYTHALHTLEAQQSGAKADEQTDGQAANAEAKGDDSSEDEADIKEGEDESEEEAEAVPETEAESNEDEGDDGAGSADAEEEEAESADDESDDAKDSTAASSDVHKGRTVFIRNLAYDTTEEQLMNKFLQYGKVKYAKIVLERGTGRSMGTGFVQFLDKASAERVIELSKQDPSKTNKATKLRLVETGVQLAGRRLDVTLAVDRRKAEELRVANQTKREKEDKRNLYLAREGVILPESDAASGLSEKDLEKRRKAWQEKKKKLQNPNYSVSKTRLSVRNIPLNVDEKKLGKVFADAGGSKTSPDVLIIRDAERVGADGLGRSKRYGFVEFKEHEPALAALRKLNNNPDTFGQANRLMVEFAIDDQRKLHIKKKRAERRIRNMGLDPSKVTEDDLQAKKKKKGGYKCHKCGERGHKAMYCKQAKAASKGELEANTQTKKATNTKPKALVCRKCKGEGHKASQCPKRQHPAGSAFKPPAEGEAVSARKRVASTSPNGKAKRAKKPKPDTNAQPPAATVKPGAVKGAAAPPTQKKNKKKRGRGDVEEEKAVAPDSVAAPAGKKPRPKKARSHGKKVTKAMKKDMQGDQHFSSLVKQYKSFFHSDQSREVKSRWFE